MKLSNEQKQLAGITSSQFGGLPALFQPAITVASNGAAKKKIAEDKKPEPLEERRTLTMFKSCKEMTQALERARKLVSRVSATVQHDHHEASGTAMNEKSRADMYRLHQELASSLDSISAANDALQGVDKSRRLAEKEAVEKRRQGRS